MNLLVTGAWQDAEHFIPWLRQKGHQVEFLQQENAALPCAPDWVEGVICNGLFLWHPIEAFLNLRYIQLTSAGFDRVPMDYVQSHEIQIRNARGVYSIPMAEFALCGVLQLYKRAAFLRESQNKHLWQKQRDILELYGKTVCMVGCGSVGTECASRFHAFGCSVIGVDLYPHEEAAYDKMLPIDQLDPILSDADVVVLTLPLTEQTRHLIDEKRIKKMKAGAVLVNIARGAVTDEAALTAALQNGLLGGAVLDVFEEEPLAQGSPLWEMENVIVTPHNSFVGDGDRKRLSERILRFFED